MRGWIVLLCLLLPGCLDDQESPSETPAPACPDQPLDETLDVVVKDMQGGARLGETASQAVPFGWPAPLPEDRCIASLEVRITWENTATAGGDLYVGVAGEGRTFNGHDEQQVVMDGSHTEQVLVPVGTTGIPSSALHDLTVWIHTDWASASANGLPVHVLVRLHFT